MQDGIIEVDLHGMNQYQAKIRIDAALKRADGSVYRLRLIHGFHGGTALRDMVRADYLSHPRVIRIQPRGDGITEYVLRD